MLILLILALLPVAASAETPSSFAYQGQLLDSSGNPPLAPTIRVAIYDEIDSGNLLFEEEHLSVPIAPDGRFELAIGLGTPVFGAIDADLFASPDRFLELRIEGETLAPRQPLESVPFSLRSEETERVSNIPIFEVIDGAGQVLGTLVTSRQVGQENKFGTPFFVERSLEIRTAEGIQLRVLAQTGEPERVLEGYFLEADCSGFPLLPASEANRILGYVRTEGGPSEPVYVPAGPVLRGVVPSASRGCSPWPGGAIDGVIASQPLPPDLPFSFPLTPILTTRER